MTTRKTIVGLAVMLAVSGWIASGGQTTGQPTRQAAPQTESPANQSSVTKPSSKNG